DGTRITDNNPLDTSDPSDETHAANWVNYLVGQYGSADQGGVKYYALGNEPMLWNSTHMDIHPVGASYDEVLATGIRYAEAIKSADPTAVVLGPVVWGWTAYFYSGLDAEPGGAWYLNPLDHLAHDSIPFLQWYLQEMAAYEAENGQRLLDVLDIHFYPQTGVALTGAGDLATQALRLRNTRVLWDPDYIAESWINENVQLIPMMRQWIEDTYPGTQLAITEYNFGGLEHVNGALAQADVLGIFGREGVELATLWAPPNPSQPGSFAFRMFRNYDGSQSSSGRFGDVSILATSDDPGIVSAFAARRAVDEKITLMLINKTRDAVATPISVPNVDNGQVEVFVYGMNDRSNIRQLSNTVVADGQIGITLEPYSITMLEMEDTTSILLGDINLDGVVNLLDVQPFVNLLSASQFQAEADMNGDGTVNLLDIDGFVDAISGN
ncbi:MAG: glycoside hydrolase family 44 protein, partial [Planctomycetota bacterium]